MMGERGLSVNHTTIYRWVQQYAPVIDSKIRKHLKLTNDSWRVDETYIKVKGKWKYLYRVVDTDGNTIDFYFSHRRTLSNIGNKPAMKLVNSLKYISQEKTTSYLYEDQRSQIIRKIHSDILSCNSVGTRVDLSKFIELVFDFLLYPLLIIDS